MKEASWSELYRALTQKKAYGAESLVLVHPYWYGREGADNKEDPCPVRGNRGFKVQQPPGQKCQSKELWGYDCPFDQTRLSADHRFPFSLGGPTKGTNLIWLCSVHNLAKAADWHLDEPSLLAPDWFDDVLKRVERYVLDDFRD